MKIDLGFEKALREDLEEELEREGEKDAKAEEEAEAKERRWMAAHQQWLADRDRIVMRTRETMAAWEEESGVMTAKLAKAEKQAVAAEAKTVQLEQELASANAKVLNAQRGQLDAMRAGKAAEAAHKMTLQQSKQWDRGKHVIKQ